MSKPIKRYQVIIQQEAIDELDAIYRFIFEDSPAHGRSFVKKLKKAVLSLKTFPRRGSRATLLEEGTPNAEIRFIEYKGYLIFYTIEGNKVIILHITGPGQNWNQFFT